ncbi:THUMP domain-containing protein [Barnesiella sp. An55]|uniref:THUMP domain-containing protein n=1 Tax=Barnesiella sp. An55 TaxID=1965646 RepID=UPI000B3A9222|nr:THUMP domain-containing protein [Barnesiella sp. An55]OUN73907.1 RNA methyltransferase [Barnesiella sp. An55]HIZ26962.1 RNA methyltransferase [Candidatus Barnesiella merdipullorum]
MNTEKFEIVAKTFQGLEDVLAEEIKQLGGENVKMGRRMVSFTGDKTLLYKANLACRTALRILKPIYKFEASDPDEVYEKMKAFPWETLLTPETTFSIDSVTYSDSFKHSKFVTYRAKDAIADYFMEKSGKRPSVRLNGAEVVLNLHISHMSCTLSLDSSGESLHKRGYRVGQTEAPINEVLAAGMILKTGWHGEKDLIDPMCGSGTILIEAALIATNTYPGIFRKNFAFERWKDFDEELFETLYNDDSHEREFTHRIYGSDISPRAIDIATQNIKSAGVAKYIDLKIMPIQRYETAPSPEGILITNPPYGERISSSDLLGLYESIGNRLKHVFKGYDAWIISYHKECFDRIGLKPSVKIDLMNGALECEYRKYEIFDGRYKEFKGEGRNLDKQRYDSPRRHHDSHESSPYNRRKSFGNRRDERPERKDWNERRDRNEQGERPAFRPGFKPKGRPFEHRDRFNAEGEKPKRLHGDEAFQKFVTFKQPSIKPNDEANKPQEPETDKQD